MSWITGIVEGVKLIRRVLVEKKKLEADARGYLSHERAVAVRLWLERMFKALEDGPANPNFAKLPKIVRWFCAGTTVDNDIGVFGQDMLKSGKLERSDPSLRKPMYPVH